MVNKITDILGPDYIHNKRKPSDKSIYIFIFLLSFIIEAGHYGRVVVGDMEPDVDVDIWWSIIGESVAYGTPYVDFGMGGTASAPIFAFMTGLFELSGFFYESFLFTVAVSNAFSGILMYLFMKRYSSYNIAIGGVIIFLSAMIPVKGVAAQPRVFAMPFIIGALYFRSPVRRGILLGIAGLIVQNVALAAPPVALLGAYKNKDPIGYFIKITMITLITVVIGYAVVGVVWGGPALIRALQITALGAVTRAGTRASSTGIIYYFASHAETASQILYVIIPSIAYILRHRINIITPPFSAVDSVTIVGLFLAIGLFTGAVEGYLVPPIAMFAMTAGFWIGDWYELEDTNP